MVNLARAVLHGKTQVTVTHFHRLPTPDSECVLVYADGNGEHVADVYTSSDPTIMDTLALVEAGHHVTAELDLNPTAGGQPLCLSATDGGIVAAGMN